MKFGSRAFPKFLVSLLSPLSGRLHTEIYMYYGQFLMFLTLTCLIIAAFVLAVSRTNFTFNLKVEIYLAFLHLRNCYAKNLNNLLHHNTVIRIVTVPLFVVIRGNNNLNFKAN